MEISGKAGTAIIGAIVVVLAITGYYFLSRPPGRATSEQLEIYKKMERQRPTGGSQGGQGGQGAAPAPAPVAQ